MELTRQSQECFSETRKNQGNFSKAFTSVLANGSASRSSTWLKKIADLLGADPIELREVCDEIRAHPEFEALVMRLSESLSLSATGTPLTVEEAAVQLGVDRLRVVVRAWTNLANGAGPFQDTQSPSRWTPESLYLSTFFHEVGLGPKSSATSANASANAVSLEGEHLAGLTDVLIRDFLSLIPFLDPSALKKDPKDVLAGAGRTSREERE